MNLLFLEHVLLEHHVLNFAVSFLITQPLK
jgi:hypothetical protein